MISWRDMPAREAGRYRAAASLRAAPALISPVRFGSAFSRSTICWLVSPSGTVTFCSSAWPSTSVSSTWRRLACFLISYSPALMLDLSPAATVKPGGVVLRHEQAAVGDDAVPLQPLGNLDAALALRDHGDSARRPSGPGLSKLALQRSGPGRRSAPAAGTANVSSAIDEPEEAVQPARFAQRILTRRAGLGGRVGASRLGRAARRHAVGRRGGGTTRLRSSAASSSCAPACHLPASPARDPPSRSVRG